MSYTGVRSVGFLVAISIASSAGIQTADAATITLSRSFSVAALSGPGSPGALAQGVVFFDQFDPAVGVLTDVELLFDSRLRLSLSLVVDGSLPGGEVTGSLDVRGAVGNAAVAAGSVLATASCATSSGSPCTANREALDELDRSYTFSTPLSPFEGTGLWSLDLLLAVEKDPPSHFGVTSTLTGSWSGRVDAVYTYDPQPVPEPASMLLLGGGVVALAYKRRQVSRPRLGESAAARDAIRR